MDLPVGNRRSCAGCRIGRANVLVTNSRLVSRIKDPGIQPWIEDVPLIVVPFCEVVRGWRRANSGGVVNHRSIRWREISPVIPISPELTVVLHGSAEAIHELIDIARIEIRWIHDLAVQKFVR